MGNRVIPFIAIVLSAALLAQHNKPLNDDPNLRSVHGSVYDASDRLVKGAVVQLENTRTLDVRSYITEGDGDYHFAGLSTNVDYEIHAEYKGKSSPVKRLSEFNDRKDPAVNLKLRD
ncbi:MAG: carboxypeptidase-like regulatory domain-containing protein [Bryobacteraceae bacterium]|jgi:hypothetical protein